MIIVLGQTGSISTKLWLFATHLQEETMPVSNAIFLILSLARPQIRENRSAEANCLLNRIQRMIQKN